MKNKNESKRLESLYELDILDTPPEESFDDIAFLASMICGVPISIVSLIDDKRQWYKSKVGIPIEVTEAPNEVTFCKHTLEQDELMVVDNPLNDPRFFDHPNVTGGLKVRFYAGVSLKARSGLNIGTLCVVDTIPREMTKDQLMALKRLARQAEQLLNLRLESKLHIKAQDELKRSEEWSHMLFNNSVDMMGIVEIKKENENEYVLRSANDAFCSNLNLDKAKILETNIFDFLPVDIASDILSNFKKVIKNKKNINFEIQLKKDNHKFWFETLVSPKTAENNEITHLSIVSRNVTERKLLDEKIAQQNLTIAQTSKFSELGELAGSMAHEINNPLTVIVSRSEKLKNSLQKMEFNQETFLKGLIQINETSQRIAKIVRSLKTISRHADSDPMDNISLKTILEDAQFLCEERLKDADINLIFHIPENISLDIEARSTQITQVLINLINNSVHAISLQTNKWIEVRVEASKDKNNLVLKCTDSGNGIKTEIQSKIMDPFFTTKEVGFGTGLGLSISRGIIESHGGSFYYDPSCKNTCFVLEIPRKQLVKSENKLLKSS